MTDHQVAFTDRHESRSVDRIHTPRPWEDSNTGDWDADNKAGARKADELVNSLVSGSPPIILGHAVKAMIELGHYGGVECGFFHRICDHLIAGA